MINVLGVAYTFMAFLELGRLILINNDIKLKCLVSNTWILIIDVFGFNK